MLALDVMRSQVPKIHTWDLTIDSMIDIYNYDIIRTQLLFCEILKDSARNNFDEKTYKEVVLSSM